MQNITFVPGGFYITVPYGTINLAALMDLSADKWRTQSILSKHLLILQLAFTKGPVREVRTETRWWLKFKKAGLLKRRFVCRTKYITTTVS